MKVLYRPDPFFEAGSEGPAITFGEGPLVSQLGQLQPPDDTTAETFDLGPALDIDPAAVYGPNWNTKGVPLHPDRKAYLEQWPNEATDEEAEVLHLPKKLWSNPTRAKMGLPTLPTAAQKAQSAYLSKQTGERRRWIWMAGAVGVGLAALIALQAFGGTRGRRR